MFGAASIYRENALSGSPEAEADKGETRQGWWKGDYCIVSWGRACISSFPIVFPLCGCGFLEDVVIF